MRRCSALALSVCLLAACGSDPEGSSASGSSQQSIEASAAPASPAARTSQPEPPFPADAGVDDKEPVGGPLSVTAVRVARHDGYDRAVFELDGREPGEPGWRVMYVDDPRRDGSGERVEVAGEATLVVLINGAGYPFDTGVEEARSVTVPGDVEVVVDVELGAVFEGVYEAFVGVSRKAPFRVFRLADPARVVIDIRHD